MSHISQIFSAAESALGKSGVCSYPVGLERILLTHNIALEEKNTKGLLGVALSIEEKGVIMIQRGLPETERREIIAHELKHLIFDLVENHLQINVLCPLYNFSRSERDAQIFASAILLPGAFLREFIEEERLDPRILAEEFQTPVHLAELRLQYASDLFEVAGTR